MIIVTGSLYLFFTTRTRSELALLRARNRETTQCHIITVPPIGMMEESREYDEVTYTELLIETLSKSVPWEVPSNKK